MNTSTTPIQDFRPGTIEDITPGLFYSVLKSDIYVNQNGHELFVLPQTPVYLERPFEQRPGTVSMVKRDRELYLDLFSLDHFTPEKHAMPAGAVRIKLIPYFTFAFLRPNSVAAVRPTDLNYDLRQDLVWISRDAPVKNVLTREYQLALLQDHQRVRPATRQGTLRVYTKEIPLNGRYICVSGITPDSIPLKQRILRILRRALSPTPLNRSTDQGC